MNILKLWVIVNFVFASVLVQAATQSAAMLTEMSGSITANGQALTLFSELNAETQITIADHAQATLVLFSTSQEFVLKGPLTVQVKTNTLEANQQILPGKTLLTGANNIKLATQDFAQAALVMRGNLVSIELLYPVQSRIVERQPVFKWKAPGSGYQYQIELLNQQGESLYVAQTQQSEFKLPDNIKLPIEQSLTWELEATKGSEVLMNQANFSVAAPAVVEQLKQLKPDSNASPSMLALYSRLLKRLNFNHEAQYYQNLLKR